MFWGLIFGWWAMVWMFWARLDHVGSAVPKEWLCITVSHAPDAMASFASFPSWNWNPDRIVAPNVDGPNSLPFPRRATMLPCYGVKVQTKLAPSGVRNMSFIKLSPSTSLQQCRLSLLVFWLCQGRRWTRSLFNYISSYQPVDRTRGNCARESPRKLG